jgi:succinate dehydrogenase / fumarate reductase cytochrome b subunit
MAAADSPVAPSRPVYLNLLAIRQPLPAIVSILHRISGALLFVAGIPWLLWLVDHSLATSQRFDAAIRSLATPFGRLALLVLAWCYIFHSLAGLRHLALDLHSGIQLQPARRSAAIMLVLSIVLTAIVAVRLW